MSSLKPIVVFEHSRLSIGEQEFEKSHFNALVKFNDIHKRKYFEVGYRKVTFKSYVGVVQVGNRVIEILPKADRSDDEGDATRRKWQHALLYMLKTAGYIKLNQLNTADQHSSHSSLMDIYLHAFLDEVRQLIHMGLVKKYKRVRNNYTSLRGRLLIEKQLQENLVHKERFYSEHTVYNRDHLLNRLLKTALDIIRNTSLNSGIKADAAQSLLNFEDIDVWKGNTAELQRVQMDRKSMPYEHALTLAKMIIMHYNPDMRSGEQHVMALLFDMNKLFEKFIFRMLRRAEDHFKAYDLGVVAQQPVIIWGQKTIRPDIMVTFRKANDKDHTHVIIDTKWKMTDPGSPSDADLKQMFTYNVQLNSDRAVLLYPRGEQKNAGGGLFAKSLRPVDHPHSCEMYFLDLFDTDGDKISTAGIHAFLEHLVL